MRNEDQRRVVRGRRVMRLTRRFWGRLFVSLLILWHFLAILVWEVPTLQQGDFKWLGDPVRAYMVSTQFNQGWNMFAPEPYTLDLYVEAHIRYADGRTVSWEFPRMAKMSYFTRYQKERWRKYIEVASNDDYRMYWPVMAAYAARENNDDPHNPPISVDLVKWTRVVPPPGTEKSNFEAYNIYTTPITAGDLKP